MSCDLCICNSMVIVLSSTEMSVARLLARLRMRDSQSRGLSNVAAAFRAPDLDEVGAAGELAVARALNLYPGFGVGTFKRPDVGCYQVRATAHPNGQLILRERDGDDDIYILVTGNPPRMDVRGWITGREGRHIGRREAPADTRPPCWMVRAEQLYPMDSLKENVR